MLLRLKVQGFKSLADVDLHFGPLTCIIGPNGAGKSNFLDAIEFLARSAGGSLQEAAVGIRGAGNAPNRIASLFTRTASGRAATMSFEADFLVDAHNANDSAFSEDLSATAFRYQLCLRHVPEAADSKQMQVESESLRSLSAAELSKPGANISEEFITSVFRNAPDVHHFMKATPSKRGSTAMSDLKAGSSTTVLAARREMLSWHVFQLQTAALRQPDSTDAALYLSRDGSFLPSALERLGMNEALTHQLAYLFPQIADLAVVVDKKLQQKYLHLTTLDSTQYDAAFVPDGVLRLLALSVLALDRNSGSVLCIEEPELHLHPSVTRLIVDLFREAVVDPSFSVDFDNPLRQIIFTTHDPGIVRSLSAHDLLVARTYKTGGTQLSVFSPIEGTWRACNPSFAGPTVSFGVLQDYLEVGETETVNGEQSILQQYRARRRPAP